MARTKTLSKQIRLAREGMGFTVAELAERLGVSQVSIHYWESGRVRPREANLAALTQALRIPNQEMGAKTARGDAVPNPGRSGTRSDADVAINPKNIDAASADRSGQDAVVRGRKSATAADIDALLARLDKGIAVEQAAMSNLLKRLVLARSES